MGRFAIVILMLFFLTRGMLAQPADSSESEQPAFLSGHSGFANQKNEFSFWVGVSFDSPSRELLGRTPDRQLIIASLRYGRMLLAGRPWFGLEYAFDFIPLAIVTNNPSSTDVRLIHTDDGQVFWCETYETEPVYGFGLSPLGLRFYLYHSKVIGLFVNASGGFLAFVKEVPVLDSRKFNYTFDFGAGFKIRIAAQYALTFGYKYHHLSNANTAPENPGLDANIFYLGVSLLR